MHVFLHNSTYSVLRWLLASCLGKEPNDHTIPLRDILL